MRLFLVLIGLVPLLCYGQGRIEYDRSSRVLEFGVMRLREALREAKPAIGELKVPEIRLIVQENAQGLIQGGYRITVSEETILVTAIDEAGAMYGSLELAEQISMNKGTHRVTTRTANPHFTVRALKVNLPWSSYRTGPAMAEHMQTCRDLRFWEAFLDQMAENRFNVLSLWNVHPFSFMVKPINFPHANEFSTEEMAEWKDFWTKLFRMCRDRGIEPFIVNWNIAVSPEFAKHYGVMERNDTSSVVRRYTREVVTQVIDEYPDLAGIGITLADWMSNFRQPNSSLPAMSPRDREDWIAETVVAGMKAAKRPVKFLHRSVLSADPMEMRRVIDEANFPDTTLVEIKFNWSHGHSSPTLLLTHDSHSGQVENNYWNPIPDNYRIQWMIRNEDFFILRWGQPEFVRQHIAKNSQEYVNGYFIGSEGYIPAKDLSHLRDDHVTWKYAFQKQWLFYKVWGRLLFNPDTPDSVFGIALQQRYSSVDGMEMLDAFSRASSMALRLASFHAATWDYTLYSEGFLAPFASNGGLHDTVSSFISVDELIRHPVLDPEYVSIEDFVDAGLRGDKFTNEKIDPLQLASQLELDGNHVLEFTEHARPAKSSLACELEDLDTWAYLSFYFADKLRAGVALQTFRRSGEVQQRQLATRLLRRCLSHWEKISEITEHHYREVPYIDHLGYGDAYRDATTFSWKKYIPQVKRDIEIAEAAVYK
jgi:hypothetical protein